MPIDAFEQLMIELVNRARMDPVQECRLSQLDVSSCLSSAGATSVPKQPLSPNDILDKAAEGHSAWMLKTGIFSHTGAGGSSSSDRARAAGYKYKTAGENIAMSGTAGTLSRDSAIRSDHLGLMRSTGHRKNILKAEYREVTAAQVTGPYKGYNAEFTTQMFGATHDTVNFVTGVAYVDRNKNGFYDIGEGKAAVVFSTPWQTVKSGAAGGYAAKTQPSSATRVTVTQDARLSVFSVDTSKGNVKIDVTGPNSVNVFGNVALASGPLVNLSLVGAQSHGLWGNSAANVLRGNSAANTLNGGGGNDMLVGGAGADQFIVSAGADVITDFQDNVDKIVLPASVRGTLTVAQIGQRSVRRTDGMLLNLMGGASVVVKGATSFAPLANDIVLR